MITKHEGDCCGSCLDDIEAGYGDDIYPYCCCRAMREEAND